MRKIAMMIALPLLLAACGANESASEQALENAAEQSNPAAAAVLENAAENGMDPQQALEQAGEAQVAPRPKASAQARPNTAQNPNPAEAGQPPEKVITNTSNNTAADEHAGHNMQ